MTATSRLSLMIACVLIGVPALAVTDDKSFVRIASDEIQWKDIPNGHGAQFATLQGDPSKPGIYVQRVKFPSHVMDRPFQAIESRASEANRLFLLSVRSQQAGVRHATGFSSRNEIINSLPARPVRPRRSHLALPRLAACLRLHEARIGIRAAQVHKADHTPKPRIPADDIGERSFHWPIQG
jgi:hypothetical protein